MKRSKADPDAAAAPAPALPDSDVVKVEGSSSNVVVQ
jgi:hypothetical protein